MNGAGGRRSGRHLWGAGGRAGRRRETALRPHGRAAPAPTHGGRQRPEGPARPPREAAEELRPPRGVPQRRERPGRGKKKTSPCPPPTLTAFFMVAAMMVGLNHPPAPRRRSWGHGKTRGGGGGPARLGGFPPSPRPQPGGLTRRRQRAGSPWYVPFKGEETRLRPSADRQGERCGRGLPALPPGGATRRGLRGLGRGFPPSRRCRLKAGGSPVRARPGPARLGAAAAAAGRGTRRLRRERGGGRAVPSPRPGARDSSELSPARASRFSGSGGGRGPSSSNPRGGTF